MNDFVLDMETGDPDDALSLCILATHPKVNLKGVTVFPGGRDQVGLVKHILKLLDKSHIPVGAGTPKKQGVSFVSGFHRRWLGDFESTDPDMPAAELLSSLASRTTSLVSGGPLTNVYQGHEAYNAEVRKGKSGKFGFVRWPCFFGEWTCQGGFVGDNLMPEHLRLPKFKGRITCPTWNFGGDVEAARRMMIGNWDSAPAIDVRRIVPKSVCHGIFYTQEVHARIPDHAHAGLDLFKKGMEVYFQKKPEGKALHDIIAAAVAIRPKIGEWLTDIEPFLENGEWGTKPVHQGAMVDLTRGIEPAPICALISLDQAEFERTLAG